MSSYEQYIKMQKRAYERKDLTSEQIVGFYDWNERFPYETHLLYRNGDVRHPIFENTHDKIALDFACGPGRMIPRMSRYFQRVDGVDISSRLIDEAREANPNSNFWVTSGDDLGGALDNTYDFVFSTIAMQHIAVHTIRMKILEEIQRVLKPGGFLTLQFAYNWRFPVSKLVSETKEGNRTTIIFEENSQHARWNEDRVDAPGTNSKCDVGIGRGDLPDVRADFSKYFRDVALWYYDFTHFARSPAATDDHGYWASHYLFVHAAK